MMKNERLKNGHRTQLDISPEMQKCISKHMKGCNSGCWWLTSVIPATQEAEIKRIEV
jgi:hypothetical protein